MTGRALTLGGTSYPVILPNVRDPRLHVAAVILTVHLLGQVGLRFQVTVPQILAAILTCAVLEVALTFRSSRAFVWPASAMLTGSGVALILRVVGTPANDPWNTYAWYVFAVVAGLSLLSKYVIKYRGSHIFNPSNIGLVVAFVVLGSSRVEPLDFWWAPLNPWMLTAYAVIFAGGMLITARLRLLPLAFAFWIAFTLGVGLLAASGHCMTARWAFAPVCGFDFWRVVVLSPEVLIFLFFMITDPKTIPAGQVARLAFGVLVAMASVLLMAPQTNEFGTKVGLLAGLVVICVARPVLDRIFPEPRSAADDPRTFLRRWTIGGRAADVAPAAGTIATSSPASQADSPTTAGPALTAEGAVSAPGRSVGRAALRVGSAGLAVLILGAGIVAAGTPARGIVAPDTAEVLDRVPHQVDPDTFPAITVRQDVSDWNHEIAGPGAQELVLTLAENLELENQALLRADASILAVVDHGDRLLEMQARLAEAERTGATVIDRYQFDRLNVTLLAPFGKQDGLSLGLEAEGTVTEETYGPDGQLQASVSEPLARTFVMRRATGDRWLNVAVLAPGASDGGEAPIP